MFFAMDFLFTAWTHNLSPFLWQFPESWQNWGPGGIRWYGISYLAGFITAYYLLLNYHFKKEALTIKIKFLIL